LLRLPEGVGVAGVVGVFSNVLDGDDSDVVEPGTSVLLRPEGPGVEGACVIERWIVSWEAAVDMVVAIHEASFQCELYTF